MKSNTRIKQEMFSVESEQAVLGSILISQDYQQEEIFEKINAGMFFKQEHTILFNCMLGIRRTGQIVDMVTLINEVEKQDVVETIGGVEYIVYLSQLVIGLHGLQDYIDIIKEHRVCRDLDRMAQSIKSSIKKGNNSQLVLEQIDSTTESIRADLDTSKDLTMHSAVDNEMERMAKAIAGEYSAFGLPTGSPTLDKTLWGLQNSKLIILGARPGVGKTAYACNLINHLCFVKNYKGLFFSLEMGKAEIIQRLFVINTQIDSYNLKSGNNIGDVEKRKINKTRDTFKNGNLKIDDDPTNTVAKMYATAMQLKRQGKLDCVFVDYISIINSTNKSGNKFADIGEIARELKIMAIKLNVPVIALAQVNRTLDTDNRRPELSDLSDSSQIEKNADIVMFLHQTAGKYEDITKIDLVIAKNRDGSKRGIKFDYVGSKFTFNEVGIPPIRTEFTAEDKKPIPLDNVRIEEIF